MARVARCEGQQSTRTDSISAIDTDLNSARNTDCCDIEFLVRTGYPSGELSLVTVLDLDIVEALSIAIYDQFDVEIIKRA